MAKQRGRSGGTSQPGTNDQGWLTLRRGLVILIAVALVVAAVQSGLFTRGLLPRGTSTDVVDDAEAVVGITSTHAGIGTTRELTTVRNNFSQAVTIEVQLTGESTEWGSLIVDGVDMGDSVGLNDLASGSAKQVDVSVVCDESLLTRNITYEVTVTSSDLTGTIQNREVPVKRYCLTWYEAADWDANDSEHGVVHEDIGDRNASDIELGYNTTEQGLIAYWTLDEESGSTATDTAGNNDGSITGATLGETGVLNATAYDFDGTDDVVSISSTDTLSGGSQATLSAAAWFNADSAADGDVRPGIVGKQNNGTQGDWGLIYRNDCPSGWWGSCQGSGPYVGYYSETNGNDFGLLYGTGIENGSWHHAGFALDQANNAVYLYVDGEQVMKNESLATVSANTSSNVEIGGTTYVPDHFDGRVDEVRVYDQNLSAPAMGRLGNGASPENTSAAFNGTLTTDWKTGQTLTATNLQLSDTVANVTTGTVNVSVQSDTNNDDSPDETSDPVTLNGSTGPYPLSGLSTDADTFRLRVELSTQSITESPCFSGATVNEGNGIGNETRSGCGMTNATANADPTADFTYTDTSANWYNDSWNNRKKITIDHTEVASNLSNFPVLIDRIDSDLAAGAQPDGDDILFTTENGSEQLDHEIEEFNDSTGDLVAWVQVPQVNATSPDTSIYMYYNNSGAPNQENITGVWASEYRGVWHLAESSGTTANDSTANDNDGVNTRVTLDDTGQIDGAYHFDLDSDYVNISDDPSLDVSGGFTVSAWINSSVDGGQRGILTKGNYTDTYENTAWNFKHASGALEFVVTPDGSSISAVQTSDAAIDANESTYVVARYNESTIAIFVNGTYIDSVSYSSGIYNSSRSVLIGGLHDGSGVRDDYNGTIDEGRVVNASRSAAWIETTYNNTGDPPTFLSIGSEEAEEGVSFDASASSDPDGTISTYKWDWDDDGIYEENSSSATTTHTFAPGDHDVTLQVVDDDSATDSVTKTITHITNSPTASFTYNETWSKRKKITIDHTKVDADLFDYPVLIDLSDPDLASKAQADGDDIMFTNTSGVQLDHELVSFDGSTGELVAWVKVPSVSASSDTSLYMYYNNSDADNQENASAVWSNGFAGVVHYSEGSGTSIEGTVGPNYTIDDTGGTWDSGKILNAYDFEEADRAVSDSVFDPPDNVGAVEYWYRMDAIYSADHNNRVWGLDDGYEHAWNSNQLNSDIHIEAADGFPTASSFSAGTWYHVVSTYDTDDGWEWYLNGTSNNTGPASDFNANASTYSGTNYMGDSRNRNEYIDGAIESIKWHSSTRSAGWWSTTYNNTNAPSTFVSVGSETDTLVARFNASNSSDPDGTVETYEWDWDDDGTFENSTSEPIISHEFDSDGTYNVTLKVTDNQNAVGTTTNSVTIGALPEAEFTITDSWDKRKAITIDAAKVESDLSNFPVLIDINDSDLAANAQADGDDILFTNTDDVKLSHEIESYDNSTGNLVAWVKVPDLSSTSDTTLYLYYSNSDASNQENVTGVWTNGYVGVWHMNDDPSGSAPQLSGSTVYGNNGTSTGSMTSSDLVDSKVGKAINFDGSDDRIDVPNDASINIGGQNLTVSTWFMPDTVGDSNGGYWFHKSDTGQASQYGFALESDGPPPTTEYKINTGGTEYDPQSTTTFALDKWHHAVETYDGSTLQLYHNGTQTDSDTNPSGDVTQYNSEVAFGGHPDSPTNRWFDGQVDEVRVSNVTRSDAWIVTTYNNQNDSSSFYSVGSETDVSSTVLFDASNSSDANGDITDYEWDWDDDGAYEKTTAESVIVHQFAGGSHDVTLQVVDDTNATNSTTKSIFAGNREPTVAFSVAKWEDRKAITIDHRKVDTDLSSFPVLVNVTDADLAADAQDDGDDILFTDTEGGKLAHEIESFNGSTGHLVAWVKVPVLNASSNTSIYLNYNNSAVANQENVTGVWDSDYRAVWHLLEDPSGPTPQMADSTANDNNGTTRGSMTAADQVTAKVDGGLDLDGSDDYVEVCINDCDSSLNITGTEFTLEAWAKPPSVGVDDDKGLIDKRDDGNDERYMLGIEDSGGSQDLVNCRATEVDGDGGGDEDDQGRIDAAGVNRGFWNYIVCRYNASIYGSDNTLQAFVNGSFIAGVDTTDDGDALDNNIKSAVDDVILGKRYNSRYYEGIYDELRISAVARPDGYITTTFNNTNDSSSFYTVGAEGNSTLVRFNASDSSDADGSIVRYEWDFTNDSTVDLQTGDADVVHNFGSRGTYETNLTVVDDQEAQNSTTTFIEIAGGTKTPTAAFTNSSMDRKPITIAHTEVEADLSNFPVLLNITDTDLRDDAQPDGSDIRFSKGSTQLDHEIELYESDTGHLVAWVKIPAVSGSENTTIHMYYNSTTSVDQSNVDGVWDSGYEGVWHLNESSGFAIDSAGFNDNGSVTGGVTQGDDALIAGGYDLGGHHDGERVDTDDIDIDNGLTVSAWAYVRNGTNESVIEKWDGADDQAARMNLEAPSGDVDVNYRISNDNGARFDGTPSDIVPRNQWVHLALTWDGATVRGYHNGSETTSGSLSGSLKNTSSAFILGGSDHESRSLDGKLDEVRVVTTKRSAAWLNTSYRNQRNPGDFYSVGGEQNKTDTITFDGSSSFDPDGSVTQYEWDFNGDGSYDRTTSDPVTVHQYAVNSTYDVTLRVTDNETATDTTTKAVTVGNPPPTASFSNSSWDARKPLTVDAGMVEDDLSNYPVLVDITDADLAGEAQANGDDILFTDSDGETKLDHEIESFNGSTGDLVAWVKVPSVSASSNTTFYMYYNNSAAANQENAAGVWDSGYAIVQHLAETSGSTVSDSSGNDNDGTNNGAAQGATGKIGTAYDFESGDADYVNVGTSASLNVSYVHYSAWVNAESLIDNMGIMAKGGDTTRQYWIWHYNNSIHYEVDENTYKTDYPNLSTDTWYKLDIVYNGSTTRAYLNGSLQASHTQTSGTVLTDDDDFDTGRLPGWEEWDGIIDEVRVRNGTAGNVSSDAWVTTSFENQDDPSGFVTVGSEETGRLARFDASGSSDDGTIATYEWDYTNDSTYDESKSVPTTFHRYSSTGTYDVTLRVTDNLGATDSVTNTINLSHSNPNPIAAFTNTPSSPVPGGSVTFDASDSSDPDGSISSYKWDWDDDGTFDDTTGNATISHTFNTEGDHNVTLEVVDGDGGTDQTTQTVTVSNATFTNITAGANLGSSPDGGVILFPDVNKDGYLDVFMNDDAENIGTARLRQNNGNNTFTNKDAELELSEGEGAGMGDYDNDGDHDMIISVTQKLHTNNGDGTFTVTQAGKNNKEEALMFADIDGDSDLDIWSPGGNYLWHENTNSGWSSQNSMPGNAGNKDRGEGASAADINNDGYLDFIWANSQSTTTVYLNDGDYTYTEHSDVNTDFGLPEDVGEHENMEWAWGDYDNDGDIDLFISGQDNEGLYQNDGTGTFTNVSTSAGVTEWDPDGAAWGDYNNDGYLDLVIVQCGPYGTGGGGTCDGDVSALYLNNGDGTFTDVAGDANIGATGDLGKTVGFFDSDNDGDLDLVTNLPVRFHRNNIDDGQYLRVKVQGNGSAGGSPTTPIGAQISVYDNSTGDLVGYREVQASYNQLQPPVRQHFGLDPTDTYDINVRFPSGTWVNQTNVQPDQATVTVGGTTLNNTVNITEA